MLDRIGYYCWAGPGTIRMLNLKYFRPRINEESLLHNYNLDELARIKELFGVTDFWVTYSWGFNDTQEEEDRNFLIERLDNFHKLGIKVHAYVQGPNLVYKDFSQENWWARDEKNRLVPYHRGRKVACLNNPTFRRYVANKISVLGKLDVDGVFMDNIQMGQLAIPTYGICPPINFFGCACKICQQKFRKETGEDIPLDVFKTPEELMQRYIDFRAGSTTEFVKSVYEKVKEFKKEFGTNSYDPHLDTKAVFGTDLRQLQDHQDYLLFENHNLPQPGTHHHNKYISSLADQLEKPVFLVSYSKGIGKDENLNQIQVNNIFSEANKSSFFPVVKGSEFVDQGQWHNLYTDGLTKPVIYKNLKFPSPSKFNDRMEKKLLKYKWLRKLVGKYFNPLSALFMESRIARIVLHYFYSLGLK